MLNECENVLQNENNKDKELQDKQLIKELNYNIKILKKNLERKGNVF